jgi:penicillin-binding protein 2
LPGAPYSSAGKTGTAQAVSLGQKREVQRRLLEEHQRDHSLYIAAFAPAEHPHRGGGDCGKRRLWRRPRGPIARRVFDYWLLGEYPSEEDMAAVRKGQASAPLGKPRRQTLWPTPVPLTGP